MGRRKQGGGKLGDPWFIGPAPRGRQNGDLTAGDMRGGSHPECHSTILIAPTVSIDRQTTSWPLNKKEHSEIINHTVLVITKGTTWSTQ